MDYCLKVALDIAFISLRYPFDAIDFECKMRTIIQEFNPHVASVMALWDSL